MKRALKRIIGPEWQFRLHRLGRLRWITKYKLMRGFGADVGLRRKLAYVLWDPEIESFSFELDNEQEIITVLAEALGFPRAELAEYAVEAHQDPELGELLERHVGRRLDAKRRQPLGHRLIWYLIARALKPELIVETGIYHGLGSLVLLRALEHNRRQGSPGELISFDINPKAGALVRTQAQGDWRRLIGSTRELLAPALDGRRVGMFIQDTPHTFENQRFEFGAALAHAAPTVALLDGGGARSQALEQFCGELGGTHHRVPVRSRDHIYPGAEIRFATFEQGADVEPEISPEVA
jgi:Methyltransferase domain